MEPRCSSLGHVWIIKVLTTAMGKTTSDYFRPQQRPFEAHEFI